MTAAELGATTVQRTTRIRRDATVSFDPGDGTVVLATRLRAARLPGPGPGLLAALREIARTPRTDRELTARVTGAEGDNAAIGLQVLLRRLDAAGWLEHGVSSSGSAWATLRPLGHAPVTVSLATLPTERVRLSRFAVVRSEGGVLQVESARSAAAVELVDPRAAELLALVAAGGTVADLSRALPADTAEVTPALLALLDAAGMLTPADSALDPEETERRFAQWSTPDLLLHGVARSGRRAAGYGGSYPLADRFAPLPALPPGRPGPVVALPVPDLTEVTAADPPLTAVLETRRSLRAHDAGNPITAAQLGELLYRSARCRRTVTADGDELVDRPYPAGGALHELEIYPVVTSCTGLAPGIWHYDTARHVMERVGDPSAAMQELLVHARSASLMSADPQVLLVITARFGRVMWKYESMAYALILKHVGVLYQTLYLVATAMGLAGCGQGGGSADLFAAATGLDYYAEGSVGEFIVGSRDATALTKWDEHR